MLKINFLEENLIGTKGNIIGIWLHQSVKAFNQNSYDLILESFVIPDFLIDFKTLLKPADVVSIPAGFLNYNLCLTLNFCDTKDYPKLISNIFHTLAIYKKTNNLCRSLSLELPKEIDKDLFFKGLNDFDNFFTEFEINFHYGNK